MVKIAKLSKEQFDYFSNNHPLHTYYQSSNYGNLMEKEGFTSEYYGFLNNQNNLIGASLIITRPLVLGYKFAYAPRGFLINYDDKNLIRDITIQFKNYLAQNSVAFLKIDPPVINNKRDRNGKIMKSLYTNDLIPFLKNIGYQYFGENKKFETLKPRWNAMLKVKGSTNTIFNNFEHNIKNKIRKAESRGIEILQGNYNDIEIFYKFIEKKHYRKLSYYKHFYESFGNNFELYFAKLNTEKYLNNIKQIYENELQKNEEINSDIQSAGIKNNISNKLTNSKINSDKVLAIYKKELENASELFTKNPEGIIIGATAIVIEKYGVDLIIEGQNPTFKLFYPAFLTKWFIIEKYAKMGAVYFDLNAITGYFDDNNEFKGLNEMKLGFGSEVNEYIGEFDLVINSFIYKLYKNGKIGAKKVNRYN